MEAGRPVKGREDDDGWDHGEIRGSRREREDTGQIFRVEPTGFTDRSDTGCDGKKSRDLGDPSLPDNKKNTKYLHNKKKITFAIL